MTARLILDPRGTGLLLLLILAWLAALQCVAGCSPPPHADGEPLERHDIDVEAIPRRHPGPREWRWRTPEESRAEHLGDSKALIRD